MLLAESVPGLFHIPMSGKQPPDPLDQPLADLIGHHVELLTSCKCTKITVFSPAYLVSLPNPVTTLRSARKRLKCQTCGERPTLTLGREYSISDGRDGRRNPPPLPEWVVPLLER